MSEILRDPIWQFIGTVVAAAAILVAIGLYLKTRKVRSFSYDIISQTPLLGRARALNGAIKEKLQITYEGKPVQQINLVLIKLLNSGNTPIISSDFEMPVKVGFGNDAEILTAEIQKRHPENLPTSIAIQRNEIVLSRNLLNKGDSITVKALVTKFQKVSVDGRITGSEIQKFKDRSEFYNAILAIALTGVTFIGIIGGYFTPSSELYTTFIATASALVLVLILAIRTVKSAYKVDHA